MYNDIIFERARVARGNVEVEINFEKKNGRVST